MNAPKFQLIEGGYSSSVSITVDPSGAGGDDGGMTPEQRIEALEKRMGKVEEKLDKIGGDVIDVKVKLAGVEGRLSQMPTTFQMLTWFIGIAIGLTGLVFTIARTVGVH